MTGPGRIGGPPPPERSSRGGAEPAKGEFKEALKKAVQKIEKVGEPELEKRGKRPPFFAMEDEEDEEEGVTGMAAPEAGAFEEAAPPPPVGFADMDEQEVPPPQIASPPSITPPSVQPELGGEEDLPQSAAFYGEYDMPDQPPLPPLLQEQITQPSPSTDKEPSQKKGTSPTMLPPKMAEKGKAAPGFASEKKPTAPQTGKAPSPFSIFTKMRKAAAPSKSLLAEWEPPPGAPVISVGRMPSEVTKDVLPPSITKGGKGFVAKEPSPYVPQMQKGEEREEEMLPQGMPGEPRPLSTAEAAREKEKRQAELGIVEPSTPALPTQAQAIAMAAMTPAQPYLSPQAASLFYQMVGTIYVMGTSTPGISTTEVLLNSPAYSSSVFYNTTITIQKYASAPDSFNIRLTGSPEAVKAFNANIDSLTSAFSAAYFEKKINFRIGRIDASYAPERPLIRRKKGTDEKGPGDR